MICAINNNIKNELFIIKYFYLQRVKKCIKDPMNRLFTHKILNVSWTLSKEEAEFSLEI